MLLFLLTLFLTSTIIPCSSSASLQEIQETENQFSYNFNSEINNSNQVNSLSEFPEIKKAIRPEEEGFYPYKPILSTTDNSDHLSVKDDLIYEDNDALSLKFNRTGSSSSDYIGDDYSVNDLGYNAVYYETYITDITAIKDFYSYESYSGGLVGILRDRPGNQKLAQGFEVKWDQAEFYRSRLYIEGAGSTDEIRVHLVSSYSENGRIKPDYSNILTSTNWYRPNNLPAPIMNGTTILELPTYNFNQVVKLSKGFYFIVLEFRDRDDEIADLFLWYGNHYSEDPLKSPLSYQSLSTWGSPKWLDINFNFTLEVELLPVDLLNQPLSISNPLYIELRDNEVLINSTFSKIENQFTGDHLYSSNTSANIACVRYYTFEIIYNTLSTYTITNSTFDEKTCFWNISWPSNQISLYYTLISRNLTLDIPKDWNDSFNWYYNQTSSFTADRINGKYISYLNSNSSAGLWKIETSSPNHLYSASFSNGILETDRYDLGYWTTNGTHAFGHNGSTILLSAIIRYNTTSVINDTTGFLNFTLYDRNGNFIQVKNPSSDNISFIDLTSYSSSGIANTSSGIFETSLTFDPSLNGSDLPGFWTAVVYWKNGTEVGFYSQKIVVQVRTTFEVLCEKIPESEMWTDNILINRKTGDSLKIRANFYNLSEPFFTGGGSHLENAEITVLPSWYSSSINLTYSNLTYKTSIAVNSSVGEYSLELLATGPFLENHAFNLNLSVYFLAAIEPVGFLNCSSFYSYDSTFRFQFVNISNPLNITIDFQQITVLINDSSLSDEFFSHQTIEGVTSLTINGEMTALNPGIYLITVYAHHEDFMAGYLEPDAYIVFELQVCKISFDFSLDIVENQIRQLEEFHFQVGFTIETLSGMSNTNIKTVLLPQGQIVITYIFAFQNGTTKQNQIFIEIEESHSETYLFDTDLIMIPWKVVQVNYSAQIILEDVLLDFMEISESDSYLETEIARPKIIKLIKHLITEYIYITIPSIIILLIILTLTIVFLTYLRPKKKKKIEDQKKEMYSRFSNILTNVASITKIIIVHKESTLPIFELDLGSQIEVDTALITGFFQAISSIGKEITKGESERVRKFDYGEFVVSCASKDKFVIYLLSKISILEEIEKELEDFIVWFNNIFGFTAENWIGSVDIFHTYRVQITDEIVEKLYIWTLNPLYLNRGREQEIKKLSKLEQDIIKKVKETNNVTISFILENLEEYSDEDKLITIFSLVENEYLSRKQLEF